MTQPKTQAQTAFETLAEIDYVYFCLNQMYEQGKLKKGALEQAIDKATGFEAHETEENVKLALKLARKIVKLKNSLEMDCTTDKKFVKSLKILLRQK